MKIIDFNRDFMGFESAEDLLLDTGIILAVLNKYDVWHTTVKNLFEQHISNNNTNLYVHSGIISEILHLAKKLAKEYMKHFDTVLTQEEINEAIFVTVNGVAELVEEQHVILNSDRISSRIHIRNAQYFGSTDALTVSIAESYGISLLTVDRKLINNLYAKEYEFPNIVNVYFTTPANMDY